MSATLTGGCACGQVRFTLSAEPKFTIICQCRACQHTSGAGHAVQWAADSQTLKVTGQTAEWHRQTESDNQLTKTFCPTCGDPLFNSTTRAPTLIFGMAGALDDPAAITPGRIVYSDEAQPWDTINIPKDDPPPAAGAAQQTPKTGDRT